MDVLLKLPWQGRCWRCWSQKDRALSQRRGSIEQLVGHDQGTADEQRAWQVEVTCAAIGRCLPHVRPAAEGGPFCITGRLNLSRRLLSLGEPNM